MSTPVNNNHVDHVINGPSSQSRWPNNVGIVNMEIYFPPHFVDQSELEEFDKVSAGKYTIGLGQKKMGFCNDREDINSLSMTVLSRLIKNSNISFTQIGRLEVGTETILDKSKSVKSVLMQLFEESGNSDVEGIDSTNACYGGTAALFNCISWVESSAWDGRYAVALCADIAVYASGNARPTGGAGAVAMLIGPDAPLVLDRGLRATHVEHVYDFYKPDMTSEYPVVDGPLSIKCYLQALDKCYQLYCKKKAALLKKCGAACDVPPACDLSAFDAVLFHAPFCKLVQKSLGRLALNDFVRTAKDERIGKFPGLEAFLNVELEKSYFDKDVEKAFVQYSADMFRAKTKPGLLMAENVGNMYTPSLYGGLVSFIISLSLEQLAGKRVGLFSYGSGLVSSFFSLRIADDASEGSRLAQMKRTLKDVEARLNSRIKVSPAEFTEVMLLREKVHHAAPYMPVGDISDLFPHTYYLTGVDERHRRKYAVAKPLQNGHA